jgi:hypothetical protein
VHRPLQRSIVLLNNPSLIHRFSSIFLASFWHLSVVFLASFCRLSGIFLSSFWHLSVVFLASFCRLSGIFLFQQLQTIKPAISALARLFHPNDPLALSDRRIVQGYFQLAFTYHSPPPLPHLPKLTHCPHCSGYIMSLMTANGMSNTA